MRLLQRVFLTTIAIFSPLAIPTVVFAQAGVIGPYSRPQTNPNPAFSPYLNLNRGGSSTAINYFGIVKPQMDANRNFQMIEQGTFGPQAGMPGNMMVGPDGRPIQGLQPGLMNNQMVDPAALLQTGHPATFFYYSHYFPMGPGGAGGRAGGPGSGPGALNNPGFGRPANTGAQFFVGGNNGVILPVNPGGSSMPTAPGQLANPNPFLP